MPIGPDDDSEQTESGDAKTFLCNLDKGELFMGVEGHTHYVNIARDYGEGGYIQFGIDGAMYLSFCESYVNSTYKTTQYVCQSNPDAILPPSFTPSKVEVWMPIKSKTKASQASSLKQAVSSSGSSSNPMQYHHSNPLYDLPSTSTIAFIQSELFQGKHLQLVDDIGQFHDIDKNQQLDLILSSSLSLSQRLLKFNVRPETHTITKETEEKSGVPSTSSPVQISIAPAFKVLRIFSDKGGSILLFKQARMHIVSTFTSIEQSKWTSWLELLGQWCVVPSFTEFFMNNIECRILLFYCLGIDDPNFKTNEALLQDPFHPLFESVSTMLSQSHNVDVRNLILEHGLLDHVLEQLKIVSKEQGRSRAKSIDGSDTVASAGSIVNAPAAGSSPAKTLKRQTSSKSSHQKKKKGVGYGSDEMDPSLASKWDPSAFLKAEEAKTKVLQQHLTFLATFVTVPAGAGGQTWDFNSDLGELFVSSTILQIIESAFQNDSLLEMGKSSALYHAALQFVRGLSMHDSLLWILDDLGEDWVPKQRFSICTLLQKLHQLSSIFLKCLHQEPIVEATNSQETSEPSLAESLGFQVVSSSKKSKKSKQDPSETTESLNQKAKDVAGIETLAATIRETATYVSSRVSETQLLRLASVHGDQLITDPSKLYHLTLRDQRFAYMNMKGKDRKYVHHYEGQISSSSSRPPQEKIVRLAQELADISNALPIEDTNAIFLRVDESRVDVLKALVIGAVGTPYAGGCFEFDIFCDDLYPNKPPKVNLQTTGAGTVRFNPNLYNCGKVCLSLLGTWRGTATENWDPKISTLLQVLCSIQAMIMTDDIYFNEPGYENTAGTSEGEKANTAYANIVKYANIRFAMLEQLRNPTKGFEYAIRQHFYLRRYALLKQCEEWLSVASTPASYTGLIADHNTDWATKFKKSSNAFEEMMKEVINDFREVFKI